MPTNIKGDMKNPVIKITDASCDVIANIPPTAAINSSHTTITLPDDTIILDAYSSFDTDGVIVSYLWEETTGGNLTMLNTDASQITVTDLEVGTYTFSLTVTDDDGATHTTTFTITVNPAVVVPTNNPPLVDAGVDMTITNPSSTSSANATASDVDGTIVSISWVQLSGSSTAVISSGTTLNPSFSNLNIGTYVFEITVTDDDGDSSSDTMTVTVDPPAFSFDGVLQVVNCMDIDGLNTLVTGTGNNIGDSYVLQGTTTPFNGGNNWFRLTAGGMNQVYNDINLLPHSTFIVQIDTNGVITQITNC